jgi:hypothetical protein
MPRRKNSPWTNLLYFLVVCAIAWAGYEFVYVRQLFQSQSETFVPRAELDELRGAILDAYATDGCLKELGPIHYRANQNVYRLDIIVEDGCEERAKQMCEEIADLIQDRVHRKAEVWALDETRTTVTRYLP